MLDSHHTNSLTLQRSYEYFSAQTMSLIKTTIDSNCHGYFNHIVHNHFKTPGKMIRPYLAYKLGNLVQASMDDLLAWATSCEMLHNATLIHDDIQDRDTHRRGQLALWTQFGDEQAINAGDFLLMSSLQPILVSSISPTIKNDLLLLFSKMSCKIVDGQSLEFDLNTLNIPELLYNKYMECVTMKTAALFSDLAVGVNVLGEHPFLEHQELYKLFSKIGILFQIQDDVIDLYGKKQRDTHGCDIKEGKISFLVAMHAKHYPEDFEIIRTILKKPRSLTTLNDIKKVESLFTRKGTLEACREEVQKMKKEILNLKIVLNNPKLKKLVLELVSKITDAELRAP